MKRASKNMAVPMTFACAGTPLIDEIQMNFGNVVMVPELKLVMMKSSKERERLKARQPRCQAGRAGMLPAGKSDTRLRTNHALPLRALDQGWQLALSR